MSATATPYEAEALAEAAEATGDAENVTGLRKAAVLLLGLSEQEAAEVLRRLPPDAVEQVCREIADLGSVAAPIRKAVFGEFYQLALANSYIAEGGLDYTKRLLQASLGDDAERVIKQVTQQVQTSPFSFLQKAESSNLMAFIQDEHPQTIALILRAPSAR